MVKLWPELWPNEKAAYRTIKQGVPELPGFEPVEYQLAGAKMKRRDGFFRSRAHSRSARVAGGAAWATGAPLKTLKPRSWAACLAAHDWRRACGRGIPFKDLSDRSLDGPRLPSFPGQIGI